MLKAKLIIISLQWLHRWEEIGQTGGKSSTIHMLLHLVQEEANISCWEAPSVLATGFINYYSAKQVQLVLSAAECGINCQS